MSTTPPPAGAGSAPGAGSIQSTLTEIDVLIRSRYPILYLLTHEEGRLETLIAQVANRQGKPLYSWTATRGLQRAGDLTDGESASEPRGSLHDPTELLQHIEGARDSAIYLLKDFHPFLEDPHVIRRLRDAAHSLKSSYKNILICSPRLNLPMELEKDVTLIDVPLPDLHELFDLLKSVCDALVAQDKASVNLTSADATAIVRAALGLTLSEAENVFSKAVVHDAVIDKRDIDLVLKEKQQIIRKSGILDFQPADSNLADVGGLANLKHWLKLRGKGFSAQAAEFGLPTPKGVLLLGAPGCGKSLTAKAVAHAWRLPLLRLDFGRIFSGLVGSSEENMRRALKVAEGVAPAVLWIDEIEKGLAGGTQGGSDGGTAARVFGTFLTWMQETQAKVFVVATANRIDALPPELLRRGRFDEIFFVDLPDEAARLEILGIQLRKKKRDPARFELAPVAQATEGFSGAEIEHCVIEGLFHAFNQSRELAVEDLLRAARQLVPLSVTYAEELRRTREWASKRATPAHAPASEAAGRRSASHLELKK